MSLGTIQLSGAAADTARGAVSSILAGRFGSDSVAVTLPKNLQVTLRRRDGVAELEWRGRIEADIPGPVDPDLIRARLYPRHAEVDLRLSGVHIEY